MHKVVQYSVVSFSKVKDELTHVADQPQIGKQTAASEASPSLARPHLKMLRAAVSLCSFGFLRSGEITIPSDKTFDKSRHLTFRDIAADYLSNPTTLRARLTASKTDPFRTGVNIFVGRSRCRPMCPVADMVARGPGQGPLFWFTTSRSQGQDSWSESECQISVCWEDMNLHNTCKLLLIDK